MQSNLLSDELRNKIKGLEVFAKKIQQNFFTGQYRSMFKGSGTELQEIRSYVPGDEVRLIDWNKTAKSHEPYVKVLREERQLQVFIFLDQSASMDFGTRTMTKLQYAQKMSAALAYLACSQRDKVGFVGFGGTDRLLRFARNDGSPTRNDEDTTDRLLRFARNDGSLARNEITYIPPGSGNSHLWRILKEISSPAFSATHNRSGESLSSFFSNVQKKKSLIFFLSDFLTPDIREQVKFLSSKHEIFCFRHIDPSEQSIPQMHDSTFYDSEKTTISQTYSTNSPSFQKEWDTFFKSLSNDIHKSFRRMNIVYQDILTTSEISRELHQFFARLSYGRR